MKRFFFISLSLIVITLLASCQKRVSIFNYVPKDYYTRHHLSEISSPKREPILCLHKSRKQISRGADKVVFNKLKDEFADVQDGLSASANHKTSFSEYSVRTIYEQDISQSLKNDDPDEIKRQRPKVLEGYGVTSMILSILGIVIPYLLIPAVVFGVISLSRHERFPDVFYGRQFAVAGLIISGIVILLYLLLIAIILALLI